MPQYLLSTQTIVDLAKRDGSAPEQWIANAKGPDGPIDEADIFISAVSHAQINQFISGMKPSADREALRQSVAAFVERMDDLQQVVPITKGIADTWGDLMDLPLSYVNSKGVEGQFNTGERLVMATAIRGTAGRPYILVTRRHPAHTALEALGLTIEDPYAQYP